MNKRIIQLCYRKIIDASSIKPWDKYVLDSSYQELLMQAQFYNHEKKYKNFAELLLAVPAAEKLHFLVSAAVTGYVQQLKGIIPEVLDNLGRHFLHFNNFRFEIINSDFANKQLHQVAINFFSEPLIWHDAIGNYLVVSDQKEAMGEMATLTHTFILHPFLSIYSVKELA